MQATHRRASTIDPCDPSSLSVSQFCSVVWCRGLVPMVWCRGASDRYARFLIPPSLPHLEIHENEGGDASQATYCPAWTHAPHRPAPLSIRDGAGVRARPGPRPGHLPLGVCRRAQGAGHTNFSMSKHKYENRHTNIDIFDIFFMDRKTTINAECKGCFHARKHKREESISCRTSHFKFSEKFE